MIKIEIFTTPDGGTEREQIDRAMDALGFSRGKDINISWTKADFANAPGGVNEKTVAAVKDVLNAQKDSAPKTETEMGIGKTASTSDAGIDRAPEAILNEAGEISEVVFDNLAAPAASEPFVASARVPGQPAPGRARRTKAEMAEDEAYFASAPKAEPKIVQPFVANPLDAQDDKSASDVLTLDSVREAVSRYRKAHSIQAASLHIPTILGCPIMQLPTDQESLAAAIKRIDTAAGLPLPELAPETPVPPAPTATKQDLMNAIERYRSVFDVATPLKESKIAQSDVMRLLQKLFGPEHHTLPTMPNTPEAYGLAVQAVEEAIVSDPFKRGAK